jgi:hypothetical protein
MMIVVKITKANCKISHTSSSSSQNSTIQTSTAGVNQYHSHCASSKSIFTTGAGTMEYMENQKSSEMKRERV